MSRDACTLHRARAFFVVVLAIVVTGCGDDAPSCSEVETAVDDYVEGETTRDEFMNSIGAGSDADAEAILQRCG